MRNLALELPINGTSAFVKININTSIEGSLLPDQYASMGEAIQEISDPVSFGELKDFYSI